MVRLESLLQQTPIAEGNLLIFSKIKAKEFSPRKNIFAVMFVLLNVKVRKTAHKTKEVCFQRFLFQTMVVILLSKVRSVNEDERTTLRVLLKECQEKMHLQILKSNHQCFFTDIDQITCFSNSIIDDIVSKCELVFSVDAITEKVPVLSVLHAFKVYDCLHRVFTNVQQQIRDE